MNREAFRELAQARLRDAEVLDAAGRYDAAYYLAGYAVECALKACISRRTRQDDFPEKGTDQKYYIHDLKKLAETPPGVGSFSEDLGRDQKLAEYWNQVTRWSEKVRYEARPDAEAKKASNDMLQAVRDPEHGVLKCLSKYW